VRVIASRADKLTLAAGTGQLGRCRPRVHQINARGAIAVPAQQPHYGVLMALLVHLARPATKGAEVRVYDHVAVSTAGHDP
jgi:hypothetical protein